MKEKLILNKKFFVIIALLLLGFLNLTLLAQTEDEKSVKDKLKNVKGDVEKIVIQTDEGDVVFEGEEAKSIFKKLKAECFFTGHRIWIDGDDENVFSIHKESDDDKEYHILKMIGEDDDHHISWVEDFEGDEKRKEVEVEIEDGAKKITVKTFEDGEEKVEVYEGEEADEYLEKIKTEKGHGIHIFEGDDDDNVFIMKGGNKMKLGKAYKDKMFRVKMKACEDDAENIEKKIEVNVEDGVKKVTVTTIKDGKETVKTYEGEEADKLLEEMEDDHHMYFKVEIDEDNGNVIIMKNKNIKVKKLGDDKVFEIKIDSDECDDKTKKVIIKKKKKESGK
jgi:hypothetical protein